MPKILVLDNLSQDGIDVFANTDGFEVDVKPPRKPDELAAIIADYDGLVVRSGTKVTAEALANPGKLKVIGRAGVGTDNIDKKAATEKGIVVMNTPGGNTIATCEQTFALMLTMCRNTANAHASMMEGRWDRKKFMGTELRGKTLGIIGLGRIGMEVAKRAKAFGMEIMAFDPVISKIKAESMEVELTEIDDIIERADIITVHAPKTDKTTNLLGAAEFKKMKPTARVINCARGGIVNEEDLAQALRDNEIAGAAIDVYTSEPYTDQNVFLGLDNIVLTPHLGASTTEAQEMVAVDVAKQMIDYLTTGAIENAVNVPSLNSEARKALAPLLFLAGRLGRFQALYMEGQPKSIEIEYSGDVGVTDTYPITAKILTGFLSPMVEMVNEISAPSLLKAHGIACNEVHSAAKSDYAFQIAVKVTTEKDSHTLAGTLYGDNDARLCSFDGIRMDARPEGCMLVCSNEDKPLIIGHLGTIIGEAGVNIANFTLGREKRGGKALTLLNIDEPISEEVLEKIRAIPHVNGAKLVDL